jgi:hypothetical protein
MASHDSRNQAPRQQWQQVRLLPSIWWLVQLRHYEALTSWRREFCGAAGHHSIKSTSTGNRFHSCSMAR